MMNIHDVRRWHGLAGASFVFFWLYLLFSGLLVNHSDMFGLYKHEIRCSWLSNWYEIPAAEPKEGYDLGKGYLSWDGDRWVLDDVFLSGSTGRPVGAVEAGGFNYVATATDLFLYHSDGELFEKREKQFLPGHPILAIGKTGADVVLQTPFGVYVSEDKKNWKKTSVTGITWSYLQDLPVEARARSAEVLAPGVPLQRVIQDIHSGRIFGRYAVWFLDVISLALVGLSISGFWLYWRLR